MRFDVTEKMVREKAIEDTYSLDELIHPDDIDDRYTTWSQVPDGVLEDEISQSVDILIDENWYPYPSYEEHIGLAEDLIYREWRNSLRRLPIDAFKDDISKTLLLQKYWVWPNHMDKYQITELMHERGYSESQDYPPQIEGKILDILADAYAEAMKPDI